MDQDVTMVVARPLSAVFARLADPTRLSSWLTPVAGRSEGGPGDPTQPVPPEDSFIVHLGGASAVGEVIGHEPPRYVAYRVTTSGSTHVLRITCSADGAGTRVHVHQSGAERLAVDFLALDLLLHREVAGS